MPPPPWWRKKEVEPLSFLCVPLRLKHIFINPFNEMEIDEQVMQEGPRHSKMCLDWGIARRILAPVFCGRFIARLPRLPQPFGNFPGKQFRPCVFHLLVHLFIFFLLVCATFLLVLLVFAFSHMFFFKSHDINWEHLVPLLTPCLGFKVFFFLKGKL